MQGLTEVLFRKVYYTVFPKGFDLAISPFISLTHGNLSDALKKIDDVLPEINRESIPVIPQILGKEPEEFVALANRLYEVGYQEVNWNIGCPMRKVAGKHRGSGILPYPDEVKMILDAIIPHLKPRLSIKMRLGYRNPDEVFNLIPILNDYPLLNITIHPRIGKQMYGGWPDMDRFEKALPLIHHPVIYNGDITTAEKYHSLKQQFPQVEDFMIGRGVLYDPLLTYKIKGIPCDDSMTKEFINRLFDAILTLPIPDEKKARKIKEYWCLLFRSIHITEQQRDMLLHESELTKIVAAADSFLK